MNFPFFRFVKNEHDGHEFWQFLCCGEYCYGCLDSDKTKFCPYCGTPVSHRECRPKHHPRWKYDRNPNDHYTWDDYVQGRFVISPFTIEANSAIVWREGDEVNYHHKIYTYLRPADNCSESVMLHAAAKRAIEEWQGNLFKFPVHHEELKIDIVIGSKQYTIKRYHKHKEESKCNSTA